MEPDKVRRFIETEYGCEVTELSVTRMKGAAAGSWKVTGTAYRHGRKILVGGTVNAHNFSGVELFDAALDDPFADLKDWVG